MAPSTAIMARITAFHGNQGDAPRNQSLPRQGAYLLLGEVLEGGVDRAAPLDLERQVQEGPLKALEWSTKGARVVQSGRESGSLRV